MESLVALVGLVVLAIPISIIVLFVGQSRLRKRVAELEQQIATQPARGAADPIAKAPDLPEAQRRPEPKDPAPRPAPWAAAKARPEDERSEQPPAPSVQDDPTPPAAVVFREERFAALGAWLRENWFYAVSALSLALAGIFLVQYGVENGFLPPTARVLAALAFGASLIGAGEVVRRRFGDDESSATAYLPSVFSGAGLVTLFGGVLAARQLYGLIGPQGALAGMIAIAIAGLVLGWFHGPLLAAIGLIGAFAAPFVVGGASDDPSWLYGYFTVIAVLGLGIDTVRRWAWISVLTLFGAYGGAVLLVLSSPSTEPAYLAFATVLAVLTIAIPVRQVWPRHGGTMVLQALRRGKGDPWPEFPTRLAFAACAVSSAILSLHWADSPTEFWLVVVLFLALILGLIVWARDALALQDVVLFPALGFVWFVFLHGYDGGSLARAFAATYAETNEADFPVAVTGLLALATLVSVLSAWRALRGGQNAIAWAVGAALYAPAMAIALEIGWHPAQVIGAYPWALHAVALAAIMVWMAERFARVDRENRLRPALATLSALSCLTFACVIVLSSAALTVALVGMVVISALLDRRFNLPPMSWFIWAGVFSITVRLVMDPGLDWANTAPVLEMTGVYGAATLGFVIAWRVLAPLERPIAILLLESAAWATGGILLSLLLLRWLDGFGEGGADQSHWGLGLLSVIWLLLAFAQVQRFALGGRLNPLRMALAVFFRGPRPGISWHGAWGWKPPVVAECRSCAWSCGSEYADGGLPAACAGNRVFGVAHPAHARTGAATVLWGCRCDWRGLAGADDPACLAGRWRHVRGQRCHAARTLYLYVGSAADRGAVVLSVACPPFGPDAQGGAGGDRAGGCQGLSD